MSVSNLDEARGYVITNGTVLVHEAAHTEGIASRQGEIEEYLGAHLEQTRATFQKMEEGVGHLGNVHEWLSEFSGILAQSGHAHGDVAAAAEKATVVKEALAGCMGALTATERLIESAIGAIQQSKTQVNQSLGVLDHALSENMELLGLIEAIPQA